MLRRRWAESKALHSGVYRANLQTERKETGTPGVCCRQLMDDSDEKERSHSSNIFSYKESEIRNIETSLDSRLTESHAKIWTSDRQVNRKKTYHTRDLNNNSDLSTKIGPQEDSRKGVYSDSLEMNHSDIPDRATYKPHCAEVRHVPYTSIVKSSTDMPRILRTNSENMSSICRCAMSMEFDRLADQTELEVTEHTVLMQNNHTESFCRNDILTSGQPGQFCPCNMRLRSFRNDCENENNHVQNHKSEYRSGSPDQQSLAAELKTQSAVRCNSQSEGRKSKTFITLGLTSEGCSLKERRGLVVPSLKHLSDHGGETEVIAVTDWNAGKFMCRGLPYSHCFYLSFQVIIQFFFLTSRNLDLVQKDF